MGAIVAVIGSRPKAELAERLDLMLQRSAYRGSPDRFLVDGVAIGIQTLGWDASLAQHEHWVVAFHGFIGNWRDLALARGVSLDGITSDAGRVALFFARFGTAMFPWLRGEFAVLILNRKEQAVIAVRDVIGMRPLFYQVKDDLLFMASEIRQVRAGSKTPPTMNKLVMASYLLYRPTQQDLTLDQSVSRVIPGCVWRCAAIKPDAEPRLQAYWTPPPTSENRRYNTAALAEELRALLDQAVTRATPSHPFAVTLSGGLDSGTIWALVADHAAKGDANAALGIPYSRVFPGMECDESARISAMRAKTRAARYVELDGAQLNPVESLAYFLGKSDGFLMITSHHLPLLARQAAADSRSTLLVGFGEEWIGGSFRYLADDLITGHWWSVLHALIKANPYRLKGRPRLIRLLKQSGLSRLLNLFHCKRNAQKYLPPFGLWDYLIPPSKSLDCDNLPQSIRRSRQYLYNSLTVAQSTLIYEPTEQLTASERVELRQPFNDLDVVDFAFRTPPKVFTGGFWEKYLLRIAVADLLASEVRDLREKTSFSEIAFPYAHAVLDKPPSIHWQLVREALVDKLALDSLIKDVSRYIRIRSDIGKDEINFSNTSTNTMKVLRLGSLYILEQITCKFFG